MKFEKKECDSSAQMKKRRRVDRPNELLQGLRKKSVQKQVTNGYHWRSWDYFRPRTTLE